MRPLKGARYCFSHSANTVHARRSASRRGGQHNRTPKAKAPVLVQSIKDLQEHVGQVLADVLLRDNTERRALAAARLVEVGRKLIVDGDIERRLDAIEARLDAQEKYERNQR